MKWFVSRAAFDLAIARGDMLARDLADAHRRYDDLLARYHESNSRVMGIAEQMTAPKPVTVNAPAPDFQTFPPLVASALAVATAGYKKDDQRRIYAWAQAELDAKVDPKLVAEKLRNGLPVNVEPEELN